ncbi:MAG: hypothetical protein ABI608_07490 [Rhizomicrobium sp.]
MLLGLGLGKAGRETQKGRQDNASDHAVVYHGTKSGWTVRHTEITKLPGQRGTFFVENGIKFSINIDRLFRYHLTGIFILVMADMFTVAGFEFFGFGTMKGLTHLFSLEDEGNLPTLFSAAALFGMAAVCVLCTNVARNDERVFWKATAAVFLLLAVDEAASIHEYISLIAQRVFHAGGVFSRAWVIPYGIGVLVFAGVTLRYLLRLPANTRVGLVVAGCVYVLGAIGFEMLEAVIKDHVTGSWLTKSLVYSLCVLCEETLEMLGIALALRTCLLHFMGQARVLSLNVAVGASGP